MIYGATLESPIGKIGIVANETAVTHLYFSCDKQNVPRQPNAITYQAITELQEYFSGTRQKFTIPIQFNGTKFQQKVWSALIKIPYGQTLSYKDLASAIGYPNGARAVGGANNANPIPIIIPCHRIIAHNGQTGGFRDGTHAKEILLSLETSNS